MSCIIRVFEECDVRYFIKDWFCCTSCCCRKSGGNLLFDLRTNTACCWLCRSCFSFASLSSKAVCVSKKKYYLTFAKQCFFEKFVTFLTNFKTGKRSFQTCSERVNFTGKHWRLTVQITFQFYQLGFNFSNLFPFLNTSSKEMGEEWIE